MGSWNLEVELRLNPIVDRAPVCLFFFFLILYDGMFSDKQASLFSELEYYHALFYLFNPMYHLLYQSLL